MPDFLSRRDFLKTTTAAGTVAVASRLSSASAPQPMRLGVITHVGRDPAAALAKVHDLGFPTCQASINEYGPEIERGLKDAVARHQIEVTTLVTLGPGPLVWDFDRGPETIGLVPRQYRHARIEHFKRAADFAQRCGIPALHTHCGFIPENHNNPLYGETVKAIHEVAAHCKSLGLMFLYETGQETPITLLRAIRDVGLDNQGINLDAANLILYGKGNPVDALDVIGPLVRGLHAKDGRYPTDPHKLGEEVPIGQGKVDFPRLIARLKELNYTGAITIEREIEGPGQIEDIRQSKAYLERLIAA